MDTKQHLYYALGIFAYAVAKADGKIQQEERRALHNIVAEESGHNVDFEYAEIIFSILQKDKQKSNAVYDWAINTFEKGKHHFTPMMKNQFAAVIQKVAEAHPPTTASERNIIDRISYDILSK